MQGEIGKGRMSASLLTVTRNRGNWTISIAVLKIFEGEKAVVLPWRVSNWEGEQTLCRGK